MAEIVGGLGLIYQKKKTKRSKSLLKMCELFSLIFEELVILLKYLDVAACNHTIGHAVNLDAAIKDHDWLKLVSGQAGICLPSYLL